MDTQQLSRRYLVLSLLALTLSVPMLICAQEEPGPSTGASLSQALVKQHEGWSNKISTPGASIRVKETGREGSQARYSFYVSGLPNDRVYSVVSWPINQAHPVTVMEGVSIGKDGIVSCTGRLEGECTDPSGDSDNAVDFSFNSLSGEPNRLALVSGDQRAAVIVVPNPITASDKGCTLSAERLTPHFEIAFFTGSGYPQDANILFDSESYGEKHRLETTADHEGKIHFAMLPFVSGHPHGTTHIKAAATGCSPGLKFDWGQ